MELEYPLNTGYATMVSGIPSQLIYSFMQTCLFLCLMMPLGLLAQHVGIGTTTPTGPLSFASNTGNKIILWGDGNANHYGFGIQGGLLQIYANQPTDAVGIGYGRSGAFNERARIYNTGLDGMYLNGRLHLRNGDPANPGGGGGVWLYNTNNTALIGFMGTQNNQNIGFFGGAAGWGFTYDVINSRVGIGNNTPNAPLAFGATLGKKITLYPGTLGDAGFGMSGNRLQIYADNPNADVAIGYDAAGVFNERFAVKPTGALAVSANTGTSGQVLTSTGPTTAAVWRNLNTNAIEIIEGPLSSSNIITGGNPVSIPNYSVNFTLANASRVLVFTKVQVNKTCLLGTCFTKVRIVLNVNGAAIVSDHFNGINHAAETLSNYPSFSDWGPLLLNLPAGSHSISYSAVNLFNEPAVRVQSFLMILK